MTVAWILFCCLAVMTMNVAGFYLEHDYANSASSDPNFVGVHVNKPKMSCTAEYNICLQKGPNNIDVDKSCFWERSRCMLSETYESSPTVKDHSDTHRYSYVPRLAYKNEEATTVITSSESTPVLSGCTSRKNACMEGSDGYGCDNEQLDLVSCCNRRLWDCYYENGK